MLSDCKPSKDSAGVRVDNTISTRLEDFIQTNNGNSMQVDNVSMNI